MRRNIPIMLALILAIGWTTPLRGQTDQTSSNKLSPAFSQAALGALADVYRWRENAQAAAKSALVPNLDPARPLKSAAYEHVRQAQLNATTPGDQQAGSMLEKHFSDVNAWVDKLIAARKNMDATNSVDHSSVDQDPDLARLKSCEKEFNAMLGKGMFTSIADCQ